MDTTVTAPQAIATVIAVEGQAFARDPSGQMRPLKAGDVLLEGDTVVTLAGGQVQLAFLDGHMLTLLPNESFKFTAETSPTSRPEVAEASLPAGEADRIIQALDRGEDIDAQLEDTAAGLAGGGDNSGNGFVRLLRIAESLGGTPFQFTSPTPQQTFLELENRTPTAGETSEDKTATGNTAPVTSLADVTVTEDTSVSVAVLDYVSDADGDSLTLLSASAAHGTIVINPDGSITYTPDPDFNGVDTIVYTVSDGVNEPSTGSITANVTPVNDPAIITGQNAGTVTEDVTVTTSGTLTVIVPDAGEAGFVAQPSTSGAYGTFTLGTDGAWTYALDNANATVQALGAGQTLTETFTVTSLDGTTSSVTVTVNGNNDPAVISSGTGSVTEDSVLSTSGTLTITDADSGQASFVAQPSTSGAYGTFTLGTDGAWTYALDNANATVQALGAGQTLTETFTVSSIDGTSSTVTVTINGTNDAAVISSGTGSVTEDGSLTTAGTLSISDTDAGQASFVAQPSTSGAYGTFTLGTDGAWTYALDNANATVQALGAGQTL
ncbi:MAG: retention module-containing protein, partial [Gammaproteobacteria bacterium]